MPTLSVPRVSVLVALLAVSSASAPSLQAQESIGAAAPSHVAYLDGAVTLERDGTLDLADANMPIVTGDRLRTTTGRVELLFPDGSALDLDEHSAMDVLSPTLVRLIEGRAMLIVAGAGDPAAAVRYQIDTPVASARIDGPGEFRVAVLDSRDAETELAVVRGFASLVTERGEIAVRAGERTVAFESGAPSSLQAFNSARFDAFDRWIAGRRDARVAAVSAQYLPRELRTYGGTLERYGAWEYAAPYGYVWYPTVDAEWRPYYNGSWSPIRSYGWTWIGTDIWSWPTHHYGRWGHAGARWFWIPGRTWGAAWVTWAAAPGYVSWSPLGFDGRPVFGLSIGTGSSWAGWTVVPRGSFGYRNSYVNRYAVRPHQLPRATSFIAQSGSPVAVPRDFARRSGNSDRGPAPREQAVPRSSRIDPRPPAATAGAAGGTVNDRGFVPGRRQESDRAASNRDFRQPLPDAGRERAVDRATPRAPQSSFGIGQRTGRSDVTSRRGDGFTREDTNGRRASSDRPTPSERPRPPDVALPRYGRPGAERQNQDRSPTPGSYQRQRPVDRSPSPAPDSRGAGADRRGDRTGSPPAARAERSAPARSDGHAERAVPRGSGSPRGGGRQR